ncbi:IQ motif, EF-hand binding site [Artemisia annua]|uniref:IQ motif, EF-hand binding site n=1 Tax=Artemisia annua TaxID=35608 RepID=A0A2U1M3J0_ARTAN|nr:IQ motif, EF-hand binding site [Artemisia annua]
MGKKGGWFSAVRKTFVSSNNDSKDKKDKKPQKTVSKRSWFGKQKSVEADSSQSESAFATPALRSPPPEPEEEIKFAEPKTSKTTELENEPSKEREPENEPSKPTKPEVDQKNPVKQDNEPIKPSYSMAYATARAAVAAAAFRRFLGKSKEEVAAIKVQTAFRRFLARRKLRGLKGVVRLRVLVQSQSVKRQAITTLRCMQTLARVQSQVRTRRIRMSEENQALQRQLMQKREREFDNMRSSGRDADGERKTRIGIRSLTFPARLPSLGGPSLIEGTTLVGKTEGREENECKQKIVDVDWLKKGKNGQRPIAEIKTNVCSLVVG